MAKLSGYHIDILIGSLQDCKLGERYNWNDKGHCLNGVAEFNLQMYVWEND